jgi:hypothetical protein
LIISSILKNVVKVLATNPEIRKKAGEVAIKAYKSSAPTIKEATKVIKKTISKNYKKK